MDEKTKKELLSMLQDISYGFDKYAEDLEDEGDFWEPWSRMHKFLSDMKTK